MGFLLWFNRQSGNLAQDVEIHVGMKLLLWSNRQSGKLLQKQEHQTTPTYNSSTLCRTFSCTIATTVRVVHETCYLIPARDGQMNKPMPSRI